MDIDLGHQGRVRLPADLQGAVRRAIERDRYAIQPAGRHAAVPGSHVAANRAQQLQFGFSGNGLHVRPEDSTADWGLEMSLCGIGYGDLTHATSEGRLDASGNRIDYQRVTATGTSVTEWYVNTSRGLEQGFTLPERPGARCNPEDSLLVELQVSGNVRPSLAKDRQSITFTTTDGRPAVRYSKLRAYDAGGKTLPSHMVIQDGRVLLAVDESAATYPLTIDPLFTTETKLTVNDGALGGQLGFTVALSADTAVVGAPTDNGGDTRSGAAYVFVRSGATWSQQAKLTVSDSVGGDFFGGSVSVSGDTALVGATTADNGDLQAAGVAYVFYRSGTTWSQQAKLTADDAAAGDQFGWSVALSGDTALVAAPLDDDAGNQSGSIYAFIRSGTTWSKQDKFTADGATGGEQLGWSLALNGDRALIGANGDDGAAGSAFVFVRSGATWSQEDKLTAEGRAPLDFFGWSVALEGDTALVGAVLLSDNFSGAAYVFVRSGTTWSQQTKLTASDAADGDWFGHSVALSGDMALVGAYQNVNDGIRSGSAYLFVRDASNWSQQDKLTADDGTLNDRFGWSVAICGDTALVGATQDDSGSVYVYEPPRDPATLLQDLIDQVQAVNTNNNIANTSLEAKLDAAVQALKDLNNNNDAAAINALKAFMSAVQAQSGKAISTAEADALIAAAQQIIDLIEGA